MTEVAIYLLTKTPTLNEPVMAFVCLNFCCEFKQKHSYIFIKLFKEKYLIK